VRLALYSSLLPSLKKMHPKLLRNSKADVPANGHEGRPCGMGNIPVHSEPKIHSGTHAHVGRHPRQQDVTTTAVLGDSCYAIILGVQPRQHRANEPLSRSVFGFIRTVGKPEASFELTTETGRLGSL
jgi:hypothetical protein